MNSTIRSRALVAISATTKSSKKFARATLDRITEAAKDISSENSALQMAKRWVISLFVKVVSSCSIEHDRMDAVAWLATARETLASEHLSTTEKAKKIYALTDSARLAKSIFREVGESYQCYKAADIPLAVKVAIPLTISAGAIVGGPSLGIAGFGSAIGMPVLLVVFVGAAGITSILEAVLTNSDAKNYVSIVAFMIARDEAFRQTTHAMRKAMSDEITQPHRQACDPADSEIRKMLLEIDPFDFEKHVMSFFSDAGLLAWTTKRSNDAGVDGFARHSNGLIVVQCKKYAENNSVGRPAVQQFKGVIEENSAWRGFIVTTSHFTNEALESASKNPNIQLIDLEKLIEWHRTGLDRDRHLI